MLFFEPPHPSQHSLVTPLPQVQQAVRRHQGICHQRLYTFGGGVLVHLLVELKAGGEQLPHPLERPGLPADVALHHLQHSTGDTGHAGGRVGTHRNTARAAVVVDGSWYRVHSTQAGHTPGGFFLPGAPSTSHLALQRVRVSLNKQPPSMHATCCIGISSLGQNMPCQAAGAPAAAVGPLKCKGSHGVHTPLPAGPTWHPAFSWSKFHSAWWAVLRASRRR